MSRLTGLLIAAGLLIGSSLLAPGGALAKEIAQIEVGAQAVADASGKCDVHVSADWGDAALPGANVSVTIYREDGAFAGQHMRVDNTGEGVYLAIGKLQPGQSFSYQVLLTRGPNHVIADGTSEPATCAA